MGKLASKKILPNILCAKHRTLLMHLSLFSGPIWKGITDTRSSNSSNSTTIGLRNICGDDARNGSGHPFTNIV